MPASKKNSLFRTFFLSRAFFVVSFVVIGFISFGLVRAYYQSYTVNEEILLLQNEVHGLEKKKIQSMDILAYVMGNNFVEDKARSELNLKKDGEHVIIFSGSEPELEAKSVTTQTQSRQVLSNAIKWWYYFFRKHN